MVKSVGLIVLLATLQLAQPTFRSRTSIVAMNVTVLDEHGAPVPRLTRDAFTITEDGRPRPIASFAAGNVPISLIVALDASESMTGARFALAREAAIGFLDRLGPDDEFTVMAFNDQPFAVAPWSRNRDTIVEALNRVVPYGSTALYATVATAIDGLRGSRNRRQALVIISDGNDHGRNERVPKDRPYVEAIRRKQTALERVRNTEALVYAIGVDSNANSGPYEPRLDVQALRDLTDPSGGSTQAIRSGAAIAGAAERIGAELRQQYVLGFTPDHPDDDKFHKVQVTVSGCAKCRVRTRSGFIADKAK
jgi:Ca-activated chloride channel family protein